MVEFIALPFSFSSKLKIWSFHVVVVQEQQRNVQKSVMHVQLSFFLLIKTIAFLKFSLPSPPLFRKVPNVSASPRVFKPDNKLLQYVNSPFSHYCNALQDKYLFT